MTPAQRAAARAVIDREIVSWRNWKRLRSLRLAEGLTTLRHGLGVSGLTHA